MDRFNCTKPGCSRRFGTREARDQHERDVHGEPEYEPEYEREDRFNCTKAGCPRRFGTREARDQHERDVHGEPDEAAFPPFDDEEEEEEEAFPPPPRDGVGRWARPSDDGLRRDGRYLGYFKCASCSRWWMSPGTVWLRSENRWTTQRCRECEINAAPSFLWLSAGPIDGHREERGHHDSSRCEACRRGVCPLGRRF